MPEHKIDTSETKESSSHFNRKDECTLELSSVNVCVCVFEYAECTVEWAIALQL